MPVVFGITYFVCCGLTAVLLWVIVFVAVFGMGFCVCCGCLLCLVRLAALLRFDFGQIYCVGCGCVGCGLHVVFGTVWRGCCSLLAVFGRLLFVLSGCLFCPVWLTVFVTVCLLILIRIVAVCLFVFGLACCVC